MLAKYKTSVNFLTWKKVQTTRPVKPNLRGLSLDYSKTKSDSKIRLWNNSAIGK